MGFWMTLFWSFGKRKISVAIDNVMWCDATRWSSGGSGRVRPIRVVWEATSCEVALAVSWDYVAERSDEKQMCLAASLRHNVVRLEHGFRVVWTRVSSTTFVRPFLSSHDVTRSACHDRRNRVGTSYMETMYPNTTNKLVWISTQSMK